MMKTCRIVLRCARKMKKQKIGFPTFHDLTVATELHPSDVDDACEALVKLGYMKYGYPVMDGKTSTLPNCVYLTLNGRKQMEYGSNQFKDYVKEKWIDFFALIVAFTALIISIAALLKP